MENDSDLKVNDEFYLKFRINYIPEGERGSKDRHIMLRAVDNKEFYGGSDVCVSREFLEKLKESKSNVNVE